MTAVSYKTPGVYVEELDAFPPSIVGVETAVPAFIGYTETASRKGRPVTKMPVKISSMVEYEEVFGGAFQAKYKLSEGTKAAPAVPADPATNTPAKPAVAEKFDIVVGGAKYLITPIDDKQFYLYNSIRLFFANGGGTCYIVSIGSYADATTGIDPAALKNGLDAVADLVGPTMLVVPDATLLKAQADFNTLVGQMMSQCYKKQDRVAILDIYDGDKVTAPDELDATIADFRATISGLPSQELRYGMAYFPFLRTSIVSTGDINYGNFDAASIDTVKTALKAEAVTLYPGTGTDPSPKAKKIQDDYVAKIDPAKYDARLNRDLLANLPVVGNIFSAIAAAQGILPPCGALAGVCTQNDTMRGVWNAPANIGIATLIEPTFKISDDMQQDLNVPINGIAVNAIRDFVGRGSLVWGARTLDGNSNDWRYIQVRRALIYVEQSVKLALNKFVFAPNTAQTWVTVTAMIKTFLHGMWAQGGLMGATANEAFTVQCGLGSTMTAQDILEGRMNVTISLQMVHPAEFIVLSFEQMMQGGA